LLFLKDYCQAKNPSEQQQQQQEEGGGVNGASAINPFIDPESRDILQERKSKLDFQAYNGDGEAARELYEKYDASSYYYGAGSEPE
jgi:hypothetical protein